MASVATGIGLSIGRDREKQIDDLDELGNTWRLVEAKGLLKKGSIYGIGEKYPGMLYVEGKEVKGCDIIKVGDEFYIEEDNLPAISSKFKKKNGKIISTCFSKQGNTLEEEFAFEENQEVANKPGVIFKRRISKNMCYHLETIVQAGLGEDFLTNRVFGEIYIGGKEKPKSMFARTLGNLKVMFDNKASRKELDDEIEDVKKVLGDTAFVSGLVVTGALAATVLSGGALAPVTLPIVAGGLSVGAVAGGTLAGQCIDQVGIRIQNEEYLRAAGAATEGMIYFICAVSDLKALEEIGVMIKQLPTESVTAICEERVEIVISKKLKQDFKDTLERCGSDTDMLQRALEKLLKDE